MAVQRLYYLMLVIQVLPHVLHVCELCVYAPVDTEISELASTVSVLPLEHVPHRCPALFDTHVSSEMVLRYRDNAPSLHYIQVH